MTYVGAVMILGPMVIGFFWLMFMLRKDFGWKPFISVVVGVIWITIGAWLAVEGKAQETTPPAKVAMTVSTTRACALARLVIYEAQGEGMRTEYEQLLLKEVGCP